MADPEITAPRGEVNLRGWPVWMQPAAPFVRMFSGASARIGYLAAVDQGLISVTNFLASLYLARQVSPTEFGVYAVGFLALHLVRAVQEGLVVQPLSALGAAMDLREFRPYASTSALFQLLLAGSIAGLAAAAGWVFTGLGNDTAGPGLFALWFMFLTWQPQEYIRRAFYARGQVAAAVVNTALASVVRLVFLVWVGNRGTLAGISGLDAIGWGALAALFPGLWQSRAYWTWRLAGLRATWLRNWRFGRWVLGGTLANWMAMELYPILTAGMVSFAAAGAYRAMQNPVAPVHVLLRAVDTMLTPVAARTFAERGYPGVRRLLRLIYLTAGLPILGTLALVALFPEALLRLFYGEIYLSFAGGMILMVVFYLFSYTYWPLQSALKAVQRTRPIFFANLGATATMLTLGLWLIRRWGVYGTIAGQALNALVVALVLWAVWRREAGQASE